LSERIPTKTERRVDRARDSVELVLDRFFRPKHWAARLAVATGLQRASVDVEHLSIPVVRPPGAPPLRIAFASDFHAGATTDRRILEAACAAIAAESPDLLLLGGDFVTTRAGYIDHLAPLIADIPAPLGKIGVFGNHDRRANRTVLARALENAGVRMLVNEVAMLEAPHGDVGVLGLDDPIVGNPECIDMPRARVRVVLMHAPDGLVAVGKRPFDVALCGHTHGGQITIAGKRPYLPQGKLSRRYAGGRYQIGPAGGVLVVSNGVGCSTVPVRVGARPQVHVITLG
jgi:predicted MPP superfamily phosphohydrolase